MTPARCTRLGLPTGADVIRLERAEAAARGVSVARLREVARERLAGCVEAQGKDPL